LYKYNIIGTIFLIIIQITILSYFLTEVNATSPDFPRQVIIDDTNDWIPTSFLEGSRFNISKCNEDNYFFSSTPDIQEVNYLSNGKTFNATLWLSSLFEEPSNFYDYDDIFLSNKTSFSQKNSFTNNNFVSVVIKNLDNKNLTLNEYTNQRLLDLRNLPSFKAIETRTTLLSNHLAHQIEYTYKKQNDEIHGLKIWTIANNKVYTITFIVQKERFDSYFPFVKNIIKSFSILNIPKNSKESTIQGYREYVNEQSGIKIQYPSDWKNEIPKNDSQLIKFYPPLKESIHKTGRTIVMSIDVNSGYDFRGEDYRVILNWNPTIRNWTKEVQESKSSIGKDSTLGSGEYITLEKKENYAGFFNKEKEYLKLSMDLSTINFPDQYSLVFFVTDSYSNRNSTCSIDLFDMSDEVHIPPPDFSFIVSPSSISLRPGEEGKMELQIKNNNAKLNSHIELSTHNISKELDVKFIPNKISVPPSGLSTSILHLKARENASDHPYTFPITSNITFPSQLINYLTKEKYNNSEGARMLEHSDVTVTVLPRLSLQEQFNDFITGWFNPITSTFTTLVTIITGIIGWRIWKIKKKKEENSKNNKLNG
jgi:hypothetical protein